MAHAHDILKSHPIDSAIEPGALERATEALADCIQTCRICADACLGERKVDMLRRCIGLNADCAAICDATHAVLSRRTDSDPHVLRQQLQACIAACEACADECRKHADQHEHCRICADACQECLHACQQAAGLVIV